MLELKCIKVLWRLDQLHWTLNRPNRRQRLSPLLKVFISTVRWSNLILNMYLHQTFAFSDRNIWRIPAFLSRDISHINIFSGLLLYNVKKKTTKKVTPQMCHSYWSNLSCHAGNPLERQKYLCRLQPPLGLHECRVLKFTFFNYLSLPSGTAATWALLLPTFLLFNVCLCSKIF